MLAELWAAFQLPLILGISQPKKKPRWLVEAKAGYDWRFVELSLYQADGTVKLIDVTWLVPPLVYVVEFTIASAPEPDVPTEP